MSAGLSDEPLWAGSWFPVSSSRAVKKNGAELEEAEELAGSAGES